MAVLLNLGEYFVTIARALVKASTGGRHEDLSNEGFASVSGAGG